MGKTIQIHMPRGTWGFRPHLPRSRWESGRRRRGSGYCQLERYRVIESSESASMTSRDHSGLTLLELLVVLVIISILSALVAPRVGNSMRNMTLTGAAQK